MKIHVFYMKFFHDGDALFGIENNLVREILFNINMNKTSINTSVRSVANIHSVIYDYIPDVLDS